MSKPSRDVFEQMDAMERELYGSEEEQSTHWSVPWADLMMVMFVLFVVLFVYSSTNKDMGAIFADAAPTAQQEASDASPIQLLVARLTGHGKAEASGSVYRQVREIVYRSRAAGVTVAMEPDGSVRTILSGPVFFAASDARLRDEASPFLDEVADLLKLNPHTAHIVGHAEAAEGDDPSEAMRLSVSRAVNTAYYLAQKGVDASRFTVTGRGASNPLLPEENDMGSSRNRRVEIIIMNKTDNMEQTDSSTLGGAE